MVTGLPAINPGLLAQLFSSSVEVVERSQVVVVQGHDRIDCVLDKYQVPFTPVKRDQVAESTLSGARYLFVGCGNPLLPKASGLVAEWVAAGGRLMTTDWMIHNLLEPNFRHPSGEPYVRYHKDLSSKEERFVPISEARWTDPAVQALLSGGEKVFWKISNSTFPVDIEDKNAVDALARSRQMGDLFEGADTLFLRFHHGRGEVLHLVSHWYDQEFDGPPPSQPDPSRRSMTFTTVR